MNVDKKDLERSGIELNVELSLDEFQPYIDKAVRKLSQEIKIDGFRPGKAPLDVLKKKIGEMSILEEAARLAVNRLLGEVIEKHAGGQVVGSPQIDITKLAPDNPMSFKVVMALLPTIELGRYRDLGVKKQEAKVDPKEVEKTLGDLREMRSQEKLVERPARDGDKVLVDIKMFLDNVPVDGGQSQGTAVILGKEYIVPGFDKQLIGIGKGDSREFNLPYPKDFHMRNLAGKRVDFRVDLKEVYERIVPEMNDDWAKNFGAKNLEDLRQSVAKSIQAQKDKELVSRTEGEMLGQLIDNSKFGDIPQILVDSDCENMLAELEHTVSHQGGRFEDYLSSLGKSRNQLKLDLAADAVKRVKVSLLLREVARTEKIEISDREMDEHIAEMEKTYQQDKEAIARLKTPEYRRYAKNSLASRKVVEKLKEWNMEGVGK